MLQETLVAACDLGRDYEHCLELQKKLNDTEAVMSLTFYIIAVYKSTLFIAIVAKNTLFLLCVKLSALSYAYLSL